MKKSENRGRIISFFIVIAVLFAFIPNQGILRTEAALDYSAIPNILDYSAFSSSNSFVITSANGMNAFSELASTSNFSGKTVYLGCDIDMSGISYTPFKSFAGTFDGNYYVLRNSSISTSGKNAGIFGATTKNATVKNLGVEGGAINALCSSDSQRVGSIVGVMNGGLVENCWSSATITAGKVDSTGTGDISVAGIAGGILGGAVVKNCYFAGKATGVDHVSGISDWGQGHISGYVGTIINCYNSGTLTAISTFPICRYSASILDANKLTAVTNCYYLAGTGNQSVAWMTGAAAVSSSALGSGLLAFNLDNGSSASRTRVWKQGELFPVLGGTEPTGTYKLTLTINAASAASSAVVYANAGDSYSVSLPSTVSASVTSSTAGAICSGATLIMPAANTNATITTSAPNILQYDANSSSSVFVVTNAGGFSKLSAVVNAGTDTFSGKSIYMLCDISFSSVSNFTPIGNYTYDDGDRSRSFRGSFYGNDHKIFDITVNNSSLDGAGLFGASYNATFERLGVYSGSISAANRAGGITGYGDKCRFNYCYNGASVTTLTGVDGTGGIAGVSRSSAVFNYCFNFGTITATANSAGGISGWGQTNVTLKSCYNVGKVTSPSSYVAFSRTGAGYANEMKGCYYLPSAAPSDNGGTAKTESALISAQTAWLLNTAGGTEQNSGAFTSTPLYPAIAGENSKASVKASVTIADTTGKGLGTFDLYSNSGIRCAMPELSGYYSVSGFIVPNADAAVSVEAETLANRITYNLNGGSFYGNASEYTKYLTDSGLKLPDEQQVYKNGSVFAGWYASSDLTGEVSVLIMPGEIGNRTYYARWATKYAIGTAAELMSFADAVNAGASFSDKYVYLTNNIDFSGSGVSVKAIGTSASPFCGVFDGKGFTIKGFALSTSAKNSGLFGYIRGATVKNLILEEASVAGGSYTGSVVGYNDGGAIVSCGSDADVSAYGSNSTISVMSLNIRVPNDASPNSLSDRTPRVKTYIEKYSPDIVGFQEVTSAWQSPLNTIMTGYSKEFVYRAASNKEATPLYWKTSKFTCLEKGTFWLSETPEVESIGWDAGYYRICSYAVLLSKTSGDLILFYNTHLDVSGSTARVQGAKLVVSRMKAMHAKYEALGYGSILQFCTGDFNCTLKSDAYKSVAAYISDTKNVAADLQTPVDTPTFNGFNGNSTLVIDFIFADTVASDVLTHKVTTEKIGGGYVSDHYGLFSTIGIRERSIGGIVGYNRGTVLDTYFKGSVTALKIVGGIAGTNRKIVMNSYSLASLSSPSYLGGIGGLDYSGTTNCYYPSGQGYSGVGNSTSAGKAKTSAYMQSSAFAADLSLMSGAWLHSANYNGSYPFLKSTAKLVLAENAVCEKDGARLTKVGAKTKISNLLQSFANERVATFDLNGAEVSDDNQNVGTGFKLRLMNDGILLDELTVIVSGDVDGDGAVTTIDYIRARLSLKKALSFSELERAGADINNDGTFGSSDYIAMKLSIKG